MAKLVLGLVIALVCRLGHPGQGRLIVVLQALGHGAVVDQAGDGRLGAGIAGIGRLDDVAVSLRGAHLRDDATILLEAIVAFADDAAAIVDDRDRRQAMLQLGPAGIELDLRIRHRIGQALDVRIAVGVVLLHIGQGHGGDRALRLRRRLEAVAGGQGEQACDDRPFCPKLFHPASPLVGSITAPAAGGKRGALAGKSGALFAKPICGSHVVVAGTLPWPLESMG